MKIKTGNRAQTEVRMKKIVVWLLALVCAFSMAGCKPVIIDKETDGDYEVNIDLDQNTEGTLSILVPSTDGGRESDIIDVLAKGFKAIYPNVTVVKHADMITDEMYMDTIGTLVQSESMPDLVYTNTAMYYYLVSKKVVVNLEPYFKATEEAGTLDMADYYSEYFNMATYEGKRYIMPRNADTVVTYFNRSMLEEAGIKTSGADRDPRLSNDWTWEDFISVCEDLVAFWDRDRTKYANYYCIRQTLFDWESVWNPIMQSVGAEAYRDGEVAIDSEETREFIALYKELIDKKIAPTWDSGSNARLINGSAAFEFASNGPSEMQKYEVLKDNFDVLTFPLVGGAETGRIGTGFAGWGISSTSENRDLAWAFLHYMISEEGQLAMCSSGVSTTPSLLRSLSEEKTWAKDFKHLNLDAFMAHGENKVTPAYFKGFDPSHMFDIQYALQTFTRNCLTSNTTAEECIRLAKDSLANAVAEI